ncbi:anti-sigma factor [Cellulomonas palmilytica]|uniref:anti-sigma factor n=1 Tax=Cellulomonas palmilytica TaxID=2608402 RepID=UPI001F236C21|nr:anti-sigma factor [Cellulomonas palmilytica]
MDDDVLALLALGEDAGTPDERAHVAGCERCTAEVAALGGVVSLARGADVTFVTPAPQVWDRIESELGLTPVASQGSSSDTSSSPHGSSVPASQVSSVPSSSQGTSDAGSSGDGVVVALPRRRVAWGWVAGAAAAGVLIGGVGVGWAQSRDARETVVASAALQPLPGWSAEGTARVEVGRDGERVLVVDVQDGKPEDGFREVWLLRPDVSGLVSLGTLTGSSGRFDLPAGLDLDEFSVVDVSLEQFDGDPAHSGDSIVRGALEA